MKWHRLVTENLQLVRFFAARFYGHRSIPDDAMSAGYLGLVEAARRFDPDRGFQFSTFARYWVDAFVREEIYQTTGMPRPHRKRTVIGTCDYEVALRLVADPAESAEHSLLLQSEIDHVLRSTARLPIRDREMLLDRFIGGKNRVEIGEQHGISRERVRQVEEESLEMLRRICR